MTSTNVRQVQQAVGTFFDQQLMPLAARVRAEKRVYFPTEPDASSGSYFKRRKQTDMARDDFEVADVTEGKKIETELGAIWEAQGFPELKPLAAAIARLAEELRSDENPDAEISPFIYTMF